MWSGLLGITDESRATWYDRLRRLLCRHGHWRPLVFFFIQFHLNLLFRLKKNNLNGMWLWYYICIWIFDSWHARVVGCSEASPWTLLVTIRSRNVLVSSSCLRTVRKYTRIGLYCISAFIRKIQPRCMYKSCYNCYKYENLNFSINS
jgi:hypothetical protein